MYEPTADTMFLASMSVPVTETNLQQLQVFKHALRVFNERNEGRGDLWKNFDARNHAVQMQSKAARCLFSAENGLADQGLDDALDMCNYAAFFVREATPEGAEL